MAAADEEGSSGEKKNDDPLNKPKGKPFSTMHQEFENKLTRTGISYEDKVGVVLSGWDHLAAAATNGQIQFATFLYKWTLKLVLQGEWPKLEKIVKTRLGATLQRCTRDSALQPMCRILLPLVSDPWGHPTLKDIFASKVVPIEEVEQYIKAESWEVIKLRVNMLVESRCEELALSFLKVCLRCSELHSKNEGGLLDSQEDHNHFFDLYFVLLYKINRKQLLEEVRQLDLKDGVEHIRRLLAQQEKGKVWKHRLKIAELEIQIFLASIIVKPYEHIFWVIFKEWCEVMQAVEHTTDLLNQMVHKYLQLSESSQHIYTMASILHQKFGENFNPLVIELLIRALTMDMNTLEGLKLEDKEGNLEQQTRLGHQMANGFMDLSAVFEHHVNVARECVLTAFSLHPTTERLQKLKDFVFLVPVKSEPLEKEENEQSNNNNDATSQICIKVEVNENNDNSKSNPPECQTENTGSTCTNEPTSDMVDKIIEVPIIDTGQDAVNEPLNVETKESLSEAKLILNLSNENSKNLEKSIILESDLSKEALGNSKLNDRIDGDVATDPVLSDIENIVNKCEINFTIKDIYDYSSVENVNEEVRLDDDMDIFIASTEHLIEQLYQDKKEKNDRVEIKRNLRCDILSAPQEILNNEQLGLTKELCDDLAVVLSSPRWQVLSWALEKDELLSISEKYFTDSDSAKNVTKELKFLNIDYNQFKHLPSDKVDEYTGIEKGYEHFMDEESDLDDYYLGARGSCSQNSSGSEAECAKRYRGVGRVRGKRGRPPIRGRFLTGTSDSDSTGRSKGKAPVITSFSESDDSDFGTFCNYKNDSKTFEGKRITAVSCNDRRKRLKVDATTGRVRQTRGSSVNHLRLYRHEASSTVQSNRPFRNRRGRPPKHATPSHSYAPSLGSVNLNPSVVLTNFTPSPVKEEVKDAGDFSTFRQLPALNPPTKDETNNNISLPKPLVSSQSVLGRTPIQSGSNQSSWRYSGYLVGGTEKDSMRHSSVPVLPSQANSVRCSYRTREGRVVTLNTRNYYAEKDDSKSKTSNASTFQDSFTEFLMKSRVGQEDKIDKPFNITNNQKNVPLETNLEYLKRQGTSVIYKKRSDNTKTLENAQKDVLNRIMSPENSRLGVGFNRPFNQPLPVRAIAMPVSHNPPNLPPNDKTSPVNLSRVLPKGTTVVRRPKPDSGAGTSGLNNGGPSSNIISSSRSVTIPQRPTISITPSNSYLVSSSSGSSFSTVRNNLIRTSMEPTRTSIDPMVSLSEGAGLTYLNTVNSPSTSTENENLSPLAVATVVGSVSQASNPRSIINISSPGETQGGSFIVRDVTLNPSRTVSFSNLSRVTSGTTTTTVASIPGESRAPSMLETLLRDRSTPTSPLMLSVSSSGSPAPTTTTSSIHEPIVASSSAMTGGSVSTSFTDGSNFITRHSSDFENISSANTVISSASIVGASSFIDNSTMVSVGTANSRSSTLQGVTTGVIVGSSIPTNILTSNAISGNVIVSGVTTQSSGSNGTGLLSGTQMSNTVVTNNTVADNPTSGMHQLLLPAQLIQVQGTDGSTGLGFVHSGSLDLRLPPGTRVIKSPSSNIRQNTPVSISQPNARPLNVLHNVKIVQNRQIVRTVVVPHSVALQSLGPQQTAQLVALSQSPSTSSSGMESQSFSKMPSQLHKMLGHSMVPGGLVIRAVRSSPSDSIIDNATVSKPPNPTTIIHHTADNNQPKTEKAKENEKTKVIPLGQSQEEGLAERLSRHYLKTALLASSNTQSVGTQTQTTAVKPVTGQHVNQVVMNHLRSISSGAVPIVSPVAVASPGTSSPLSLGSSNAVSSETLEQLREFESVFEKVSNKSVKESETITDQENFTTSNVSSEESMIAAQLLSMANETPAVTTASSFVYSVPSTVTESVPTTTSSSGSTASSNTGLACLSEGGTFITLPCTSQSGTLILVNPSASGIVTMSTASGVHSSQPPLAASPALSSTSSHSSVASSPSSTSSKSKSKNSKTKVLTPPNTIVSTKPKSPPPPKAPPKPAVAKPQVEESDETKARIQAILDRYKQDLANTPQPQPAPRNRKNCPPPKNEGKSSSKKKSAAKKPDGTASASPSTSDSGHLPSVSPSPAPLAATPSGEDSEGSMGGTSTCSHFQDDKPKIEETLSSSQILQGVVVSNMKVDGTGLGANITTIPQGLAGGRLVQFIRHGTKVTAITTRQPFQKSKTGLTSGGPPPNVTIQGRINMNDLMESHLASLLAGGSATINQNSPLITKLIQSQQHQSPSVQQLVVHTTTAQGQQVLQQVSLQSVIAAHANGQLGLQTVSGRTNSESCSSITSSPIKTPQPHPSPNMSSGIISASPSTPHHRVSSPSTPSPAPPDLPRTPSSFPTHEEDSNSSAQSHDGGPAGPLPPFFTLTKQFMSPQQNQQFREKALNESSRQSSVSPSPENMRSNPKLLNSQQNSSVNLGRPQSFDRSETSFGKNLGLSSGGSKNSKYSSAASVMFSHSAPSSPLINSADVLDISASESSSLESSPSVGSQRLPTLNASSTLRSNSLDSVKSDLSVEEVQIPPSPATLTKQLQNAYMTEAALSPAVSQTQMSSSSSYSSPTTVQDLPFEDAPCEHRPLSPNLGHPSLNLTYSLAGASSNTSSLSNVSNCSTSHNNHVIDNSSLACLSSPSGDVYLDQAGVGLGLDSLPLVEGRPRSPLLSDLVPAVPLLSWSPRSADSMMGQSPSLNDALTGNITLDVNHSEDSLCDSSTGFPGLFSMEGDGASVSSSTSEEQTSASSVFPILIHSQLEDRQHISSVGKKLPSREQDHTISSTRCEDLSSSLALHLSNPPSMDLNEELPKKEESNSSVASDEELWRSAERDIPIPTDSEENDEEVMNLTESKQIKKGTNVNKRKKEGLGKRKSQRRQMLVCEKKNSKNKQESKPHNGYEGKVEEKNLHVRTKDEEALNDKKSLRGRKTILNSQEQESSSQTKKLKEEATEDVQHQDFEGCRLSVHEVKTDLEENMGIQTRGTKRRSDSGFLQDGKRSRSNSHGTESETKHDDQLTTFDDCTISNTTRSLRSRHISGTSDSSSNFSMDRVSTPGLIDSPMGSGSSTRRKRRKSRDSSVSSRDSSPLTVLLNTQHDGSATTSSGIHTRRSSSRDHVKKTRCRCCVDQQQSSQGGSSRRMSGRVSRGSGPSNS